RLGFQAVGVSSTVAGLLPVFFASTYLNAVAPSGGTAGAAVFVADAKRRGESPARAAVGTVVVLIADLATLLPFLAGGLLFLARRGRLAYYDLLGASLYVVFVSGLVLALTLARHRVRFLTRALGWIERLVARVAGWFRRSSPLGANWAHRVATDLSAAAVAVFGKPRIVAQLVLAGTALHVVNLPGDAGGPSAGHHPGVPRYELLAPPRARPVLRAPAPRPGLGWRPRRRRPGVDRSDRAEPRLVAAELRATCP
ncbi:MAG: hypothetical protein P8Y02_03475, partial [Deinococcales bacterium]